MSFSFEVKNELLSKSYSGCCANAKLSAIIHTCGSLNINKQGLYAEIRTENENLAKLVVNLFNKIFNVDTEIQTNQKSSLKKNILYTVATPSGFSEQILQELCIINLDENNHRQIVEGIDNYLVEQNCCKVSYLCGAFLSCGSITVPIKNDLSNLGYNLRFLLSNIEIAQDLKTLLEFFSIKAKITERKNGYMVYVKENESICDFLALIKASKSFLKLQSLIVERDVKNNTNRQTNCILANIDKSVNAAIKQIEAINKIEKKVGLDSLPQNLQKIAKLRQEYPDVSLQTIAKLCGENLTKSGINHRMRKIIDIANKIN